MQKVRRELQAIRQEYKEIIKVQNPCFQLRIAKIARADIRGRIAIKKAWKWDKFQENPETNFESALNQRETVNKRNFYNTDKCKANQREKRGQHWSKSYVLIALSSSANDEKLRLKLPVVIEDRKPLHQICQK